MLSLSKYAVVCHAPVAPFDKLRMLRVLHFVGERGKVCHRLM
jgi:hypothetical protein